MPSVSYRHAAPTTSASEKTRWQCRPTSSRINIPDFAISVGSDLLLVTFKLFSRYIALVVIFDQYLPVVERLAMAIAPVRSPILNHRTLLALAIHIHSSIEGILEN
jgi:hypothetical protein